MMLPNPETPPDPLVPGTAPGGAELRGNPRYLRRVSIEFLNMGDDPRVPFYQDFVPGVTEDVSDGGLRVRVPYDIREGAEIGVVIRNYDRFQVFLAKVIWKIRGGASCLYGLSIPRLERRHLP
jgi:hypothetical protein